MDELGGVPGKGTTAGDQPSLEEVARQTIGLDPGLNIGPNLLGPFFDASLLGVEILLLTHWLAWGHKDRMFVRILIWWSFVASLASSIFNLSTMVHYFAIGFGSYAPFLEPHWTSYYGFLIVIQTAPTQMFYLDRAYKLNDRSKPIFCIIAILIATSFACVTARTIKLATAKTDNFFDIVLLMDYQVFYYLSLSSILAGEAALTSAVMYGLWRSRTGWSSTDTLIKKLLKLTLEAQLPAMIICATDVLVHVIWESSPIGNFFDFWYPKVFGIGLLALLNSRFSLLRDRDPTMNTWLPSSGVTHQQATVHVTTETYVESHRLDPPRVGVNRQVVSDLDDISEEDKYKDAYELSYIHNESSMGLTTAPEEREVDRDEVRIELR